MTERYSNWYNGNGTVCWIVFVSISKWKLYHCTLIARCGSSASLIQWNCICFAINFYLKCRIISIKSECGCYYPEIETKFLEILKLVTDENALKVIECDSSKQLDFINFKLLAKLRHGVRIEAIQDMIKLENFSYYASFFHVINYCHTIH